MFSLNTNKPKERKVSHLDLHVDDHRETWLLSTTLGGRQARSSPSPGHGRRGLPAGPSPAALAVA